MTDDFAAHNEEVRRVWDAYFARKPVRVPMRLSISSKFTMGMPEANPEGIFFEQYFKDPRAMLVRQLRHEHWVRTHLPRDVEMGLPDVWPVYVDFQNCYEAMWFGCEVEYVGTQVPDTKPNLSDDRKTAALDAGIPSPETQPWIARSWEYFEFFRETARDGYEYEGRPIEVGWNCFGGTDGPMTVCCNLRGATEFCLDLLDDPAYADEMLAFVTEATIVRLRYVRERLGIPLRGHFGFADDSCALLSDAMYRERVMPHHRRLIEAFTDGSPSGIHLCGNATHLFKTLVDELGIRSFDTGFPVDHGALRRSLGPDVEIVGGPAVPLLLKGTPDEVCAETRRILESGVTEGGRFILQDGNNLAPGTPAENIAAMYAACKAYRL
ncbi:MAG: hypothetical protein KIS66_08340 [Fimbriimonadaceae bacterium]|nr:hypothetical protein [Fimbriimonadaceae bacterium]